MVATGQMRRVNYDSTPLTSVAITRNGRNMETSRVATIAAGNTVTRSVADSTSGRDLANGCASRGKPSPTVRNITRVMALLQAGYKRRVSRFATAAAHAKRR